MKRYRKFIEIIVIIIVAAMSGAGLDVVIRPTNLKYEAGDFKIELATTQQDAVTSLDIDDTEIVTVEAVDGTEMSDEMLDEMAARGAYYDTSSLQAFINATQGKCVVEGNVYGSQCVSLAQAFWTNYAGRGISTCGTGAARGIVACSDYNAGDEFKFTTDVYQIIPGAWVVTDDGTWGHIAEAVGYYNNGYLAVYGENQGGESCAEGGSKPNIINLSMKHFLGAFIPKSYIPAPTPEPVIPLSNCIEWGVKKGDTMSKIMMECEGTIQYGEIMNEYARTWYSRIVKPGQSVYDGWISPSGVGLFESDIIDHKI